MAGKKVKLRLQGHEKFALREGWINKALMILPEHPDAFTRKDATDLFGIGSNMVKSLRYWMRVLGLIHENGVSGATLTELGKLIYKYDPYLENIFSLWILHSNIAKNKEEATTWYMYFNHCDADDLDKNSIESILLREVTKYAAGQKFSEKSLSNDIDVLLNMYSKRKEKCDPEEKSISPFSQLKLVNNVNGKYIKKQPSKKEISEMIVLYELMLEIGDSEGISIDDAIYKENGLKNIYNLGSVMANEYLDKLDAAGYIRVNRTAGLDMIYPVKKVDALTVLEKFYKNC